MRIPRLICVLACWLTTFNLMAQEKISCLPPQPANHSWFNISDVIWSAFLASTVAVTGVLISDWKSTRRTRMQLEHDARERDRERKSALRKEVYLSAAEEQAKAVQYLSSLPQADLTDPVQSAGMSDFFASAAKVQLVCDPKTYSLVSELVSNYGSLLLRLLGKVSPIHSIQNDIKIRSHHIDRYTVEVDRILAMMSANNESGVPDPNKMRVLQSAFEFNQ